MNRIKINNKVRIWAVCLMFLFVAASCNGWLSVSPETEVKYEDQFSDRSGFKDQLTGIYTALCAEDMYGAHLTYGMMDALGQQYTWKLEAGNYYYLHRFEYDNPMSVSIISGVWNKMYNAIANVNMLLKAIDEKGGVLTQEERDIYEGEALALRAYLHFDVVRLFAKSYKTGSNTSAVPYVRGISKHVTLLSTVEDALKQAKQDLEEAKMLLANDPIKTGKPNYEFLGDRIFHLNYYAVCAELARLDLYMEDKTGALHNAEEVIKSGKFQWVDRDKITISTREERDGIFTSEAIFMLNNTKLEALANKYLREGRSGDQFNVLISKPEVIEKIFETDQYGGVDWRYVYFITDISGTYKASTKLWQYETMPSAYKNRQPLLRTSEMYLIAAECTTDKEQAVAYINELRQHRGFDAIYDLQSDISETKLKEVIGKEYRKEFIGEGQWFFYCKRNDIEELPDASVPFSKSFYVLPIPQQEKEYGNRTNN